jgi:protein-tyrosine-phosphatase
MSKPAVLILCTGNSCRSHLAEGILRAAAGDLVEVHSAGSKPAGYVHPKAIQVMKEHHRHHGLRQRRPGLPHLSRPGEPPPLALR